MNPNFDNPLASEPAQAEVTLRLIASLPPPEDLENRVHAALRAAPRTAHLLAWPRGLNPQSGWVRTAAAATIVSLVAGGGWGVYLHVQQAQPVKVIVMPAHMPSAGGFSSAGAMRTPQTLHGPTVTLPAGTHRGRVQEMRKPASHPKSTGTPPGKPVTAAQPALQPR